MKLKALLVAALCALGVTAAVAVAKPPPGKGKPDTVAAKKAAKANDNLRCRGGHMQLRGDLVSVDFGQSSFTMLVKQANKHGRANVEKETLVHVGEKTKVLRHGKSSLDKLQAGDRVTALVRACRDADGDAVVYAKQVVARGPKAAATTTTTATTTSTSTSTETTTTP